MFNKELEQKFLVKWVKVSGLNGQLSNFHEGPKLHEDTFARRVNFARRNICKG